MNDLNKAVWDSRLRHFPPARNPLWVLGLKKNLLGINRPLSVIGAARRRLHLTGRVRLPICVP